MGGPCPALLSASGPCQWTGQGKAKRGLNPLQSDNGGGGGRRRKECTDSPPHPSPASNLSSGILQLSLQGRSPRGQDAGYRRLRAPTPPPLPLSISFCGKPLRVAQTLGVRPRTAVGLRPPLTEEPRRVLLEGAGCGGKGAVNSGRRPGWLPGWVCGSQIFPPVRVGAGKAAAESRLGLGALQGPSLLLDPSPRPISCQDPRLHRRRVLRISVRNPESKGLQELAARKREKFRNMAQPPYFILV